MGPVTYTYLDHVRLLDCPRVSRRVSLSFANGLNQKKEFEPFNLSSAGIFH